MRKAQKTATVSLLSSSSPHTCTHVCSCTHTHTHSCPHLVCSPPCPALPWGSGSSNCGILLHQPHEKEVTSARANVSPGPGAQTHLCLNFSFSTPWALRLLAGSAGSVLKSNLEALSCLHFPTPQLVLLPIRGPAFPPNCSALVTPGSSFDSAQDDPTRRVVFLGHGYSLPISRFYSGDLCDFPTSCFAIWLPCQALPTREG